jgi:UDP-arabinose 4-epimerase
MTATVLVTGGAGYIGSHACKALARAGWRPVTYDNLVLGHASAVKWGPLEQGDVLDGARLRAVCAQYKPVAVIHFAALAHVAESMKDPSRYYRNNLAGSLCLADAARECGNLPIVFSSTCATYGESRQVPIGEDAPQAPINPYGTSKLMVERLLKDFDAAYGLKSIALRYFNAAGADRDGEIGEDHDPETHLIPLALAAAGNRGRALTVFGGDYPTQDGTAIRDYIHVEDLAAAHVAALRRLLNGGGSLQVNVGTGKGASVLEVIAAAEAVSGEKVARSSGPRRPGDPPELVADPSRLKETLGLDPGGFAGLVDIVATAWRWHRKRHAA